MAAPSHSIFDHTAPAAWAATITASDSTVLSPVPRAFYVGGDGDIVATMAGDGADITFTGCVAGMILPIRATKIKAATSATNIVALY